MTEIQEYSATEAALSELASRYKGVVYDVTTAEGLTDAKTARKELAGYRIALEKKRVEIKAPALRRAQLIDSEARRITTAISALEDPIDDQIKADERRKEAERQAAIKAEEDRIAAEAKAKRDAEEAALAAERAELARQRAEVERSQREAAAKIEAEQRAARQKIEEEERASRLAREEADRVARKAREEEEAKLKVERDRLESERRAVEESQRRDREAQEQRDRAARLAKEAEERKVREAEEARQREIQREKDEALGARAMLTTFKTKYGHRKEFSAVVEAIDSCLMAKAA